MKKTISISIAQTLFYVEEDGFALLENYLKDIHTYFASFEDRDEIISDIESRIREQFLEYSTNAGATDRIVTKAHVDALIKTMGWPNEFGIDADQSGQPSGTDSSDNEQKEESQKEDQKKQSKKLYRDPTNKIIAGVASGIAAYFGIDPVIVRVLFFISIFFGGFGIIVYIILWFAVPQALTPTQQLEMRGDAVTLQDVKKMVQEKVAEVNGSVAATGTKKVFNDFFSFIGSAGERFFKGFGKFLGGIFKFVSLLSVIALTILFIALSIHPYTHIAGVAIPAFRTSFYFLIIVSIWYVCILIPLLFLTAFGYTLQGRKAFSNRPVAALLFAIWIIALVFGGLFFARIGETYIDAVRSSPSLQETTVTPTVAAFTALSIQNGMNVEVTLGDTQSISITGPQLSIDHTAVQSKGDTLEISKNSFRPCFLCSLSQTTVTITTPTLSALSVENGSRVTLDGTFTNLSVTEHNASGVDLTGSAQSLMVSLTNASRLNASAFVVQAAHLDLSNASRAEVNAQTSIDGKLSNGSSLSQYGTANTSGVKTANGSHIDQQNALPPEPELPE